MELFYRKYGDGPPLIIIHGLYGSSDNWISVGKELADNFRVYIIDQRNHGQSIHRDEHDYNALSEDLKEFMDQQGIEKASLLGHSMGGKTAMFFAAKYKERVSNLIVVDIAPVSYHSSEDKSHTIHYTILDSMAEIDLSAISRREEADEKLKKNIPQDRLRQFLLKNLKRRKDGSFFWSLNINTIKKEFSKILEGFDPENYGPNKEITGFPTLFIRGSRSAYITENTIPEIRRIFPYAEIATIEDAGHWVHAEKQDEFIHTIRKFIFD